MIHCLEGKALKFKITRIPGRKTPSEMYCHSFLAKLHFSCQTLAIGKSGSVNYGNSERNLFKKEDEEFCRVSSWVSDAKLMIFFSINMDVAVSYYKK